MTVLSFILGLLCRLSGMFILGVPAGICVTLWYVVRAARKRRWRAVSLGCVLIVLVLVDGYVMFQACGSANRARLMPASLILSVTLAAACLMLFAVTWHERARGMVSGALLASAFICLLAFMGAWRFRGNSLVRLDACRSALGRLYVAISHYRVEHGAFPDWPESAVPERERWQLLSCYDASDDDRRAITRVLADFRAEGGLLPSSLDHLDETLSALGVGSMPARIYVKPGEESGTDAVLVRDGPHTICGYLSDQHVLCVLYADGTVATAPFEIERPDE